MKLSQLSTIDFEDADGFIVSQDFKIGLYIGANEIKEFTGVVLIPLESSLTVDHRPHHRLA